MPATSPPRARTGVFQPGLLVSTPDLWSQLESAAQRFMSDAPDIAVAWSLNVLPGLPAPRGRLAHAVLSIFDQLLSNVLHHSGATQVCLRVSAHASDLTLLVKDNGRGAPPSAFDRNDAYGMHDMRQQAAQFGGWLYIDSQMGVGTQVILTVPLFRAQGADTLP